MPFLQHSRSAPASSAPWSFFHSPFGAAPVAASSCCARRRRPSLFSAHKVNDSAVRIVYTSVAQPANGAACTSVVGGRVGIPFDADDIAARRRVFRSHLQETLPVIPEDSFVCEDCHADAYRPDVVLSISSVHTTRPSRFHLAEYGAKKQLKKPSTVSSRKGKLPMQLNQLARQSKNAFANFPRRQSPRV